MKINNLNDYLDYIVFELKKLLKESKSNKFILGISGGIDSVLMAYILKTYFNKDQYDLYHFDIDSTDSEIFLIQELKKDFDIKEINLTKVFNCFNKELNINSEYNQNNIKPKIRSMFLYNKALEEKGLVLGCINYDEYYLGYFTKFGDSQADVFALSGLRKKDVYDLAKLLKVKEIYINQKPSPGYNGVYDEEELGITYSDLDLYHENKLNNSEIINKIEMIHKKNKHKQAALKFSLFSLYFKERV